MPKLLEIPPPADALRSVGEHDHGKFKIRIEFYENVEGAHFVWPYIRLIEGSCDNFKHFMVQGHFATKDEARAHTLDHGRKLIEAGFDVHTLD